MSSPDFAKWLHLNGEMIEGVSSADSSTLLSLGSRSSKAICAVYSWIVLDVEEGGEYLPCDDWRHPRLE